MSRVLAIDPGPTESAWLLADGDRIVDMGIEPNGNIRNGLSRPFARFHQVMWPTTRQSPPEAVVIEWVESYGMAVGKEVFETVRWIGRFEEAAHPIPVVLLPRRAVREAICHDGRAKDPNIRRALMDRFGGAQSVRKGSPLYGVKTHLWSALAVAVAYSDSVGRALAQAALR